MLDSTSFIYITWSWSIHLIFLVTKAYLFHYKNYTFQLFFNSSIFISFHITIYMCYITILVKIPATPILQDSSNYYKGIPILEDAMRSYKSRRFYIESMKIFSITNNRKPNSNCLKQ